MGLGLKQDCRFPCCRVLIRHSTPNKEELTATAVLLLFLQDRQKRHLSDGSSSVKSWKARYLRSWELASRLLSTHAHSARSAGELTSPLLARVSSSICIERWEDCPYDVASIHM